MSQHSSNWISKFADSASPVAFGETNLGKAHNLDWSWKDLGERLSKAVRSEKTVEEYSKLKPEQKTEEKNAGGWFYAGHTKDGHRRNDSIRERCIVYLDGDQISDSLFTQVMSELSPISDLEFFAHTTRSDTPEKRRLRIVLRTNRMINSEEHNALMRILAYRFDPTMKAVDPVSFRWAQLMFFPTISKDQEYVFVHNPGEEIDVDAVLASFPTWQDVTTLPKHPNEDKLREKQKKAQDPTTKGGWVGAFCRAYDVVSAIDAFDLPYAESDRGWSTPRYTYIPGHGANGAVVHDNGLFLYSHHGTDPCADRLVNSFDLVRIHLYGDLDEDEPKDTDVWKLPSYKKMIELASQDPDVIAEWEPAIDPKEVFEDHSGDDPEAESRPRDEAQPDFAFDDETGTDEGTDTGNDEAEAEAPPKKPKKPKSPNHLEAMNKRHAFVFTGGRDAVITFKADGKIDFGPQTAIEHLYANEKMPLVVANDKTVKTVMVSKGTWWLNQPGRRTYPEGMTFQPGIDTPGFFNLWQGFSVEPNPEGSCQLYLDHLFENVCQGNTEAYAYLIGWLAHMIKKPMEKPGVAVVLRGLKGVGKDVVFKHLRALFIPHYHNTGQMEQVTGKFNAHLEGKLLLHIEEGFWAGNKKAEGALKTLITSEQQSIERKGVDVIMMPSLLRLAFTSNERWVVPASWDERRYFILNVGSKHRLDRPYFRAIEEQLKAGGYGKLLHFLQTHDLAGFDVGLPPQTIGLSEQKIASLKGAKAWWYETLLSGTLVSSLDDEEMGGRANKDWRTGPIKPSKQAVYKAYEDWWVKRKGFGHDELLNDKQLGTEIKELCPSKGQTQVGKHRITAHELPPLAQARREFSEKMQSPIDWGEDEEDDLVG